MTETHKEMERWRKLLANTTQGEWTAYAEPLRANFNTTIVFIADKKRKEIINWGGFDGPRAPGAKSLAKRKGNAEFIAAAHNDLPALLAAHETLLSANAGMREALEFYETGFDLLEDGTEQPTEALLEDAGAKANKALCTLPTGEAVTVAQPLPPVEEGVPSGSDDYQPREGQKPQFAFMSDGRVLAGYSRKDEQGGFDVRLDVTEAHDAAIGRAKAAGLTMAANTILDWQTWPLPEAADPSWQLAASIAAPVMADHLNAIAELAPCKAPSPSKERVEKLEEALRLIAEDADRSLSNENNRQLQVDGLKVIKATVSRALLETEGK